jgi:hypothetical protein
MAVNIAQAGANEVMADWNGYKLGNIAIWGDTTLNGTIDAGTWEVTVQNLNGFVYFIDATGTVTEGGALWAGATRRIGVVTRIIYAQINPPAALTTRGKTGVKGGAAVIGDDTDPTTWGAYCSGDHDDKPGILTNDTSDINLSGGGTIEGTPPYDQDSTIVDSTFTTFGDMTWDDFVELAKAEGKDVSPLGTNINMTQPDSSGPGVCRENTLTNWGDTLPGAACGAYFPLIYHGGPTLTIQSGGIGQGVLLVDGTLDLRGNFVFWGIIIVQGTFQTQGSGNRVMGGVLAANADFDSQSLVGGSVVHNSTCAVERAILNNSSLSRARPLTMRSWIDLTDVTN